MRERKYWDERRARVSIRVVQKCIGQLGCVERVSREIYPFDTKKILASTRDPSYQKIDVSLNQDILSC